MTLDVFERVVKLTLGSALAICEAAWWGGRASTFTFIGGVLLTSEIARLAQKRATPADKQ